MARARAQSQLQLLPLPQVSCGAVQEGCGEVHKAVIFKPNFGLLNRVTKNGSVGMRMSHIAIEGPQVCTTFKDLFAYRHCKPVSGSH